MQLYLSHIFLRDCIALASFVAPESQKVPARHACRLWVGSDDIHI